MNGVSCASQHLHNKGAFSTVRACLCTSACSYSQDDMPKVANVRMNTHACVRKRRVGV